MGSSQSQAPQHDAPIVQSPKTNYVDDPQLQSGYFGVTLSQQPFLQTESSESEEIDPEFLVKIKSAYQRGYDDGVSTSEKIKVAITEEQKSMLREKMVASNKGHVESMNRLSAKFGDSIAKYKTTSSVCEEEREIFLNSLNAQLFVDLGLSIRASQALYSCAVEKATKV